MQEDFLQYIWKHRLLPAEMVTEAGEQLVVLHPGTQQPDAGPDFFNARVKIGATEWAGNVEVHVKSSDWIKHGHGKDKAYEQVVLHVVYENDVPIKGPQGKPIPALELKNKIDMNLYGRYSAMMENQNWIPCQKLIGEVSDFTIKAWLDRMLVQRLERKTSDIQQLLELTKNDWAEAFYTLMARSFGFKVNAQPFEMLARSLPQKYLGKHKDNLLQLEAMLLGQAGFLEEELKDEYPNQLKKEYRFLRQKFNLQPLQKHLWKFSKLRPPNFPTIRLAQFAQLIHGQSNLLQFFLGCEPKNMANIFDLTASAYWDTHYLFDKAANKRKKQLGAASANVILINTVVPFLFHYGKHKKQEKYTDRALALLEMLPAEKNSIISKWQQLNISARNAYATQALLELKNEHCTAKKCLSCGIGSNILKP